MSVFDHFVKLALKELDHVFSGTLRKLSDQLFNNRFDGLFLNYE